MKFVSSLLFLTSLAVSGSATTVSQIQTDITNVGNQLTTLNSAINAFSAGGTLPAALTIHGDAQQLINGLKGATTDAQALSPSPVSEADGRTILNQLEALEPSIETALSGIQSKKAAFQALPIAGATTLVLQDLVALNASTYALEQALLKASPADIQTEALALGQKIGAAFASVIAVYQP